MSILRKLEVVQTPHRFAPMTPSVAYRETSQPVQHTAVAFAREFSLVCTIGTSFIANPAMYEDARKDAERMLHVGLFRDLIPLVYKCKDAVHAGNAMEANKYLVELLHRMNGGEYNEKI